MTIRLTDDKQPSNLFKQEQSVSLFEFHPENCGSSTFHVEEKVPKTLKHALV